MITNDDILNMNFYKKEKFTGSYLGMRYLILKDSEDAPAESGDDAKKTDIFRVTNWPEPYGFAATPDEKKTTATFPFTPEGKEAAVAWLNEQWKSREDEWPRRE